MAESTEPNEPVTQLWKMADLITPMAVRVAATLRVADLLDAGHDELPELAAKAGVDPVALRRLLRYLVARGVFAESERDRFALNPLGQLLLDDHPTATRGWLDLTGFGGRMDLAFFDLLGVVTTGRPKDATGKQDLTGQESESYDDVMEAQSRNQAPAIVAARDWTACRHIVDVAGGTGTLLAALLEASPTARGSLVELPETAAKASTVLTDAGLADRVTVVGGDMLEAVPKGGDAYVLKFVLHFLEDDEAITLLTLCREAAGPGARIMPIETTVERGEDQGDFTSMDLRMLILGHGRERTVDEYARLAEAAGLRLDKVTPTDAGIRVLEFVPV